MTPMAKVWQGNWRGKNKQPKKLEIMIFEDHNTLVTLLLLSICGTSHSPGMKLNSENCITSISFVYFTDFFKGKKNVLVYRKSTV